MPRMKIVKTCKYCDKICEWNKRSGSLTTCGSECCKNLLYKERQKKIEIGRKNKGRKFICVLCLMETISKGPPNKKYCDDCIPDTKWFKRLWKYGIGKKEWEYLLKKQNGTCALCKEEPTVVDHCHNHNYVRGLLCHSCNINIMIFDKNDEFVKKAIKYTGKSYV